MKYLHENLDDFRDFMFFSILEDEQKSKDPKKQLDAKEQAQAAKDAQDVVKKVRDNFGRFKSYAGNKIEEYKNFWQMQKAASHAVTSKDQSIKRVYAMFNDGTTDKYKPTYIVGLKTVNGKFCICVIKTKLEENEKNPVFNIIDKQASDDFINFIAELKEEMKNIKDHYVKTVESKKKEEEHKQKREKIDKFLKESKQHSNKKITEWKNDEIIKESYDNMNLRTENEFKNINEYIKNVKADIDQIFDYDTTDEWLNELIDTYKDIIKENFDNKNDAYECAQEILDLDDPEWKDKVYGGEDDDY